MVGGHPFSGNEDVVITAPWTSISKHNPTLASQNGLRAATPYQPRGIQMQSMSLYYCRPAYHLTPRRGGADRHGGCPGTSPLP